MRCNSPVPLLLLTCLLVAPAMTTAQCSNNLLLNGNFVGPEGTSAAPGWTGTLSPDINDDVGPLNSTPGYVWIGTPLISPNGGTWQNMWGTESISQTVTVVPGDVYQLCFHFALQGIMLPAQSIFWDDPVGVDVMLNGNLVYSSPLDSTPYSWETACTVFIAPTPNITLTFMPNATSYVAIDGACLQPGEPTTVQAPSRSAHTVFPNPVTDRLNVVGELDFDAVSAMDLLGARVPLSFQGKVVDVSALPRGAHLVEFWSGGTRVSATMVTVVR